MLKKIKLGIPELILLLITFSVFTHTLYFDFFIFDDSYHLSEDPNIFMVTSWKNFLFVWKNSFMPVMYNFWQMMIFFFGHDSAVPHRLALIIFHALNSILVFSIAKSLLKETLPNPDLRKIETAAFIGAFAFLIHPSQVESVVWISSMKGAFSTLFALLAIVLHIRMSKEEKVRLSYQIGLLLLYALSILSKPSSALLPVVLILIDFYIFNRSLKNAIKRSALTLLFIIPFAIFFFMRSDPNSIIYITTFWQRLIIFFHSNVFYLKKIVFPFKYTLDYGNNILNILREYITITDKVFLFGTFTISIGVSFLISFVSLKGKVRFLPIIIFLVLINLFTGLIPFDFQNVSTTADRYMYFPLVGISIYLTFLFYHLKSKFIRIAIITYLGLFFITTLVFSNLWKDQADVLMSSYEKNPNSYMLNIGLGELFFIRNELQKSKIFLQKASFISPNQLGPHQKLLELYALSTEHQQGYNYINFLKKKLAKMPLSMAIYEVDFLIGLKRFDEASKLINEFQKKFPNHEMILDRIDKFEFELGSSHDLGKKK